MLPVTSPVTCSSPNSSTGPIDSTPLATAPPLGRVASFFEGHTSQQAPTVFGVAPLAPTTEKISRGQLTALLVSSASLSWGMAHLSKNALGAYHFPMTAAAGLTLAVASSFLSTSPDVRNLRRTSEAAAFFCVVGASLGTVVTAATGSATSRRASLDTTPANFLFIIAVQGIRFVSRRVPRSREEAAERVSQLSILTAYALTSLVYIGLRLERSASATDCYAWERLSAGSAPTATPLNVGSRALRVGVDSLTPVLFLYFLPPLLGRLASSPRLQAAHERRGVAQVVVLATRGIQAAIPLYLLAQFYGAVRAAPPAC